MNFGIPIIKLCSECASPIEEKTLLSGNTSGAIFWTDGKMDAPMLPDQHLFYMCPHCNSLLWSSELEEFISPRIEDMNLEDDSDSDRLINAIDIRNKVKPYIVPNMYEYLYELFNIDNLDIERTKYIRIQAWWAGNDIRRSSDIKKPRSRQEIDNLIELNELLDSISDQSDDYVNNKIFQAEIKRELSLFDESSQILSSIKDDQSDIFYTINNLNKQHDPHVYELEKYNNKIIVERSDDGVITGKGLMFKEKRQGIWTNYFWNGNKHSKGEFINGQMTGEWFFWHPNGVKYRQGSYSQVRCLYSSAVNGGSDQNTNTYCQQHGEYKSEIEEMMISGEYLVGEDTSYGADCPAKKGLWKQWYDSGSIEFEGCYNITGLPFIKDDDYWDSMIGSNVSALCYKDGLWKTYYKNKQLKKEVAYRFDKAFGHMDDNLFDSNTKGLSEEFGLSNEWHDNGSLKSKGLLDSGHKTGEWKYWYDNNQLALSCSYDELGNVVDEYKEWYRNGQKKLEHIFDNHSYSTKVYPSFEDGFKADTEWSQDGQKYHNIPKEYYHQPFTKTCYKGTPYGCLMVVNTEIINTLHTMNCRDKRYTDFYYDDDSYIDYYVSPIEYISTSAIARELNIKPKDLIHLLVEDEYLEKNNSNKNVITNKGKYELGGLYRTKEQDEYTLTEDQSSDSWPVWPIELIHDYINNKNIN